MKHVDLPALTRGEALAALNTAAAIVRQNLPSSRTRARTTRA